MPKHQGAPESHHRRIEDSVEDRDQFSSTQSNAFKVQPPAKAVPWAVAWAGRNQKGVWGVVIPIGSDPSILQAAQTPSSGTLIMTDLPSALMEAEVWSTT